MSRKRSPNWEKFAKLLLWQAGVKPPCSFWEFLHLLQQSLPKDTPNSDIGKTL